MPPRRHLINAVMLMGLLAVARDSVADVWIVDEAGGGDFSTIQEAILAEVPVLERFLSNLAVFAAVAPLLGLLGTVSGMIQTFETITLYGAGNAGMLSGGISEALITTETGLAVAIPILLAHAALARRAKVLIGHMDQAAMAILDAFARQDQDENHDAASVN